jgi:hypothetical protein
LGTRLNDFPQNIDYLTSNLKDPNLSIRLATIAALESKVNKFPQIETSFLNIINDNSQSIYLRQNALLSLAAIDTPEIKDIIIKNLNNPSWQLRQAATLVLGNYQDSNIPDLLKPLSHDSQWQVKQAVAISLGNFHQPQSLDCLKQLLNDNYYQIVQETVNSLGKFNNPEIVNLLTPKLEDNNLYVRQNTVLSLETKIADYPQLIDPFVNLLKTETDFFVKHLTAETLKGFDSDLRVVEYKQLIEDSLLPGVHLENSYAIRGTPPLQDGIEVGYVEMAAGVWHTFLRVTNTVDGVKYTRTLSFDPIAMKDWQHDSNGNLTILGFLKRTVGIYNCPDVEKEYSGQKVIFCQLPSTQDQTNRLFNLIPNLNHTSMPFYLGGLEIFGDNCYTARNVVLRSLDISPLKDTPFTPLKGSTENIHQAFFSITGSVENYSFTTQKQITYISPGVTQISETTFSRYQTNLQSPITNYGLGEQLGSTNYGSMWNPNFNNPGYNQFPQQPNIPDIPKIPDIPQLPNKIGSGINDYTQ